MKTIFKVTRLAGLALAVGLSYAGLSAQVYVATDGDVGIGTSSPSAKLHVVRDNNNSSYLGYFLNSDASSSSKYGLYNWVNSNGSGLRRGISNYTYGNSTSTGSVYGLYNYTIGSDASYYGIYNYNTSDEASTSSHYGIYNYNYAYNTSTAYGYYSWVYQPTTNSNTRYGIYTGVSSNGTGTHYGIYATATGTGNYAGYFAGDVHVAGNLTWTSDARKKTNIAGVSNALALVSQLQPKTYDFLEEKGTGLPEGRQYGLLAQDVEKILPELVKTIKTPKSPESEPTAQLTEDDIREGKIAETPTDAPGELEEMKSVNYVALIPILIQAVKDQQAAIEAQNLKIQAQEQEIKALRTSINQK